MEHLRARLITIIALTLSLHLTSCAPDYFQAYKGAPQPESALSFLKGNYSPCHGSMDIADLDGHYSGSHLAVLPGEHRMKILATSSIFGSEDPLEWCVRLTTYSAIFSTKAGMSYRFNAAGNPQEINPLSVWTYQGSNVYEGVEVDADTQVLHSKVKCEPYFTRPLC